MFIWILLGSFVVASISVLYLIANMNGQDPCNVDDYKKSDVNFPWGKPVCKYGPPLIAFTAILLLLFVLRYFITVIFMGVKETVRSAKSARSARSAGSAGSAGSTGSKVK